MTQDSTPVGQRCIHTLLAPNAGPMTLTGTQSYLLHSPGGPSAALVDPGPRDARQLAAIMRLAGALRTRIGTILLTHSHPDHVGGVPALVRRTDAEVLDFSNLSDGQELARADLLVRVVATPGHSHDSLSFLVPAESALLVGDHMMGEGTPVVVHPDGDLAAYLESLQRVRGLALAGQVTRVLPGHGPVITDVVARVDQYLAHRSARLDQVRGALAAGARSPDQVVDLVYAGVPDEVRFAALMSVRAQLEYLRRRGEVAGLQGA